jgi:hypothetical protein
MASPVNRDNYKQIKKLAHFESDARYFDALLADLQRDHEERLYIDEYSLNIYSSAQMVRDTLYRLLQRMRGVSDYEISEGMM